MRIKNKKKQSRIKERVCEQDSQSVVKSTTTPLPYIIHPFTQNGDLHVHVRRIPWSSQNKVIDFAIYLILHEG